MKLFLLSITFLMPAWIYSQDSLFTFSTVIKADSMSRDQIFNKASVWCSKIFYSSKDAINVSNREGGVLAGKASLHVSYKIPTKKDSTAAIVYNDYFFDWLIEIKDGKLRLSAKNFELKDWISSYPVTMAIIPPDELGRRKEKWKLAYKLSRIQLDSDLNNLGSSLEKELLSNDNW